MPVRAHVISDADKAFGREFTGLNPRQADEMRAWLARNRKLNAKDGKARIGVLPRDPAGKIRLYFREVKGEPIPESFMEIVGRTSIDPPSDDAAKALMTKYTIDARLIHGTGPGGAITVEDVRKKLQEIADNLAKEMAQKVGTSEE